MLIGQSFVLVCVDQQMFALKLQSGYPDQRWIVDDECGYTAGDLIVCHNEYYVIRYQDQEFNSTMLDSTQTHLIHRTLISAHTLQRIDWMVRYRYSTYNKVLALFLPAEWSVMSKYPLPKSRKPRYQSRSYTHQKLLVDHIQHSGQQLIVFPDLWTLTSMVDLSALVTGTQILYSTMSLKQKITTYRNIKCGHCHTLICTHSQLFQDRHSLRDILIIDPHKRYYKNSHTPKYFTQDVVEYVAHLYHAQIQIWSVLSLSSSVSSSS